MTMTTAIMKLTTEKGKEKESREKENKEKENKEKESKEREMEKDELALNIPRHEDPTTDRTHQMNQSAAQLIHQVQGNSHRSLFTLVNAQNSTAMLKTTQ
jgi:hypothetical protein